MRNTHSLTLDVVHETAADLHQADLIDQVTMRGLEQMSRS